MISRRILIKALALSGLGAVLTRAQVSRDLALYSGDKEPEDASPHQAALALVWEKEKKTIVELDFAFARSEQKKQKEYVSPESRWWFDTDERQWKVYRPMFPGTIDSTHAFKVVYLINNKDVGGWFVDLRKNTVAKTEYR